MDFFYLSFFPQLVAGPIVRARDFIPQIRQNPLRVTREMFGRGLFLIMTGLVKKAVISDYISVNFVDRVFDNPMLYSGFENLMGVYGYALQIYCDFSGYSDMAIGLGRMIGFEFKENFNYPYISRSVTEFWRRWHMSLGTWFRDYVYIPLGGNRCGRARQLLNILIVWALTGIWHGANWTFLLWGLYYAVFLMIEKVFLLKRLEKLPVLGHIYTIIIVMFGWVMFQLDSLAAIGNYTSAMLGFGASGLAESTDLYYLGSYAVTFVIAIVASTPLGSRLFAKLPGKVRRFAAPALIVLALVLCTAYLVDATYNPFIYFNF